jgi:hypothetical protein
MRFPTDIPGDQDKLMIHKQAEMVQVGGADHAPFVVNHGRLRVKLSSRRRKILVDANALGHEASIA